MLYLDEDALANAGIAPTPEVSQTKIVQPTHNVVNLIDVDGDDDEDLSSEVVHKVGNVPQNENDQPEDDKEQAEEHNR